MSEIESLVRENIRRLSPYSCARNEYDSQRGVFLDANENPFGRLNRYPDPFQKALREEIGRLRNIPVDNIFLGNGSDEVIDLCLRIFCEPGKDRIMIFPPTYGMYEVAAAINDVEVVKIPLNDSFDIDLPGVIPFLSQNSVKVIFICSPNNPTANLMNSQTVEFIIQNFSGIIVIDEAYSDFCDSPSFIGKINLYRNIVVMQTFSKALGLAAARVGMAFANAEIISYMNKVKPPYNISALNQSEALKKLKDKAEVKDQVDMILNERERLSAELKNHILVRKVFHSDSNFLLVEMTDADSVYMYLISREIIVRNRSSDVRDCLRITVGTPEENDRLIHELRNMKL